MTEQTPAPATRSDVTDMLTEAAAAMVSSTYPAPQAEEVLRGLAAAYDADAEIVLLPTLVLTETKKHGVPQMRSVKTSYRFDQMTQVQSVMAQARHNKEDAHDVAESLRAIATKKPIYPSWLRVIGYALSALGFGAAFRLDLPALLAVTVLGLIVGMMVLTLSRSPRFAALLPLMATFVAGLMIAGLSIFLDKPDPVRMVAMLIVVLLPGATLTSGIIELVSGYMISGASRLMYALMILGSMAFGGALAIAVSGIPATRLEDVTATLTPVWVAWAGAALYGIGTFLYFCTPVRLWLPSLFVMMVSFGISVLAVPSLGVALSAGIATAVGLITSWAINARLGGGPGDLAIFLPTFWLIVPGSTGFIAITGELESAKNLSDVANTAAMTFFAMAIGMMLATAVYPLLSKIAPDTKLIMRNGAGLILNTVKIKPEK
ncbi:MAG: threonine/serine exporter family protein [Aurantimicrobium sp.]|uniref:threonine/serine ThrE exporter family protein n=1 Tax=Aurantimicrobium sp. TaxID=1930784 RepID=UPI002FC957B7